MHKLHNTLLKKFNESIYSGFISTVHLKEEVAVKKDMYWLAQYNKKNYLITHDLVEKLPFRIDKSEPLMYRGKVYHQVTEVTPVEIQEKHSIEPYELLDWFILEHTNKEYYKQFMLLMLSAIIGRVNFRVATEAGFGKDSAAMMLGSLMNDVSVTNPRTTAAVEYRLLNKLVVLNEMSNLTSEQRHLLQELLLMIGDYKNTYEKSSRATASTLDTYDVSQLSLVIFHNMYWDYKLKKQEDRYFDNIFTQAVQDRFMPFAFTHFDPEYHNSNGVFHAGNPCKLDMTQFRDRHDKGAYQLYEPEYKTIMREIKYLRNHYPELLHNYSRDFVDNFKLSGRHIDSFDRILDFVDLFSRSKEEFERLATNLYHRHLDYFESLNRADEVINRITEANKEQEQVLINYDF